MPHLDNVKQKAEQRESEGMLVAQDGKPRWEIGFLQYLLGIGDILCAFFFQMSNIFLKKKNIYPDGSVDKHNMRIS